MFVLYFIQSLTQEQRLDVLQKLTYNLCCAQDLDLPRIAQRTAVRTTLCHLFNPYNAEVFLY